MWIRMYSAKQRASLPVSTSLPATEQVGVSIGEGVIFTPAAFSCANSLVWAAWSALTSGTIAVGVMSGVPVICSCLRLSLTVERPLVLITIEAIPKAIRTAAATMPPISKNLRVMVVLLPSRSPPSACDLAS